MIIFSTLEAITSGGVGTIMFSNIAGFMAVISIVTEEGMTIISDIGCAMTIVSVEGAATISSTFD
jgi:hypothetical protein